MGTLSPCPDGLCLCFYTFFQLLLQPLCDLLSKSSAQTLQNRMWLIYNAIIIPNGQFCPKPHHRWLPRSWMGCLRSDPPLSKKLWPQWRGRQQWRSSFGETLRVWESQVSLLAQYTLFLPLPIKDISLIVNIYGNYFSWGSKLLLFWNDHEVTPLQFKLHVTAEVLFVTAC